MKNSSIWTPYAIMFSGIWLASVPFIFGYQERAMNNDIVCGIILFFLGLLARPQTRIWVPWTTSIVGLWLQFAPLIFWAHSTCYLNDSIVGILVVTFSIIIPDLPKQLPDTGPSIPPGWSYNPSSWGQRIPISAFALVGWLISRYLAAYQLGHIDTVWDPFFGEASTISVLTSSVSQSFPVPDAGLGSLAYITEALLTLQSGERRWRTSPWMVIIFGILVVPLGMTSIILITLQPLVVGAWCSLCIFTAFCMLLPVALGMDEVVATIQYLRYSTEKSVWKLFFQGGVCPTATIDKRSPHSSAPIRKLLRSSWWGVTAPWNLQLCIPLGLLVLFLFMFFKVHPSMQSLDDIVGPLIVVVAVISFSETIRKARFFLLALAGAMIMGVFLLERHGNPASLIAHLALAAALILLTFRKGPIKEKTKYLID
jgi:hypothetical protein